MNQYSLLTDADYGGVLGSVPASAHLQPLTPGERCVWIDFLLGHSNTDKTLTLTIPALEQSIPEVIPDEEFRIAQEKLKAQGIEVDYTSTSSASGGGGGGPIFNKILEGMDWQEAFHRLMEALGYIHSGPWSFTIEVP